jgi:hypothetical protein
MFRRGFTVRQIRIKLGLDESDDQAILRAYANGDGASVLLQVKKLPLCGK